MYEVMAVSWFVALIFAHLLIPAWIGSCIGRDMFRDDRNRRNERRRAMERKEWPEVPYLWWEWPLNKKQVMPLA